MKTKKQIMRGCGSKISFLGYSCGELLEDMIPTKLLLCQTCQALLNQINEIEKKIDEIDTFPLDTDVDDVLKKLKKEIIGE